MREQKILRGVRACGDNDPQLGVREVTRVKDEGDVKGVADLDWKDNEEANVVLCREYSDKIFVRQHFDDKLVHRDFDEGHMNKHLVTFRLDISCKRIH